jgi:hypothetical protein
MTRTPPRLLIYGELRGELRPCGCNLPKRGGLEQLVGILDELANRDQRTVIELGNWTSGMGTQAAIQMDHIAAATRWRAPACWILGDLDLHLGVETIERHAHDVSVPLLCANLVDATGQRRLAGWTELLAADGRPLIVVGLLPAQARPRDATLTVIPPLDAWLALQPKLPAGARIMIAGCLTRTEALQLGSAAPNALVCWSSGTQPPTPLAEPLPAGGMLVAAGGKGRYLTSIPLTAPHWQASELLDVQSLRSVPPVAATISAYRHAVRAAGLLQRITRVPPPEGKTYLGDAACSVCHDVTHRSWLTTRHADALASLMPLEDQHDPDCVRCHVTGLSQQGGYLDPTAPRGLDRVGCEACHGPGSEHAKQPRAGTIHRGGPLICRSCHDGDHDPHFEYDRKWPSIAH